MRYSLEKYKGPGSRYRCPSCGAKGRFSRYVGTATGEHVADHVGWCERINSCGYHRTPSQYFASADRKLTTVGEDPILKGPAGTVSPKRTAQIQPLCPQTQPDYIPKQFLIETLCGYENNTLVQFLLGLFPSNPEDVIDVIGEYFVGTKCGYTILPIIDQSRRVCKGQARTFTPAGHRDGESSFEHLLKKEGKISHEFETDKRILFGEHLLPRNPDRPVAIVEAAKTALIARICKRVFPDYIWLASGSLSWLSVEKLERIGIGRKVILFPDANGYRLWKPFADETRRHGIDVEVSDLLEKRATESQKQEGIDLADLLIAEQRRRIDPLVRLAYTDMIEERMAIMTVDGLVNEADAESWIGSTGFNREAERIALLI